LFHQEQRAVVGALFDELNAFGDFHELEPGSDSLAFPGAHELEQGTLGEHPREHAAVIHAVENRLHSRVVLHDRVHRRERQLLMACLQKARYAILFLNEG